MRSGRVLRHLVFWGIFFCISLFNELYFSSTFASHPEWKFFFLSVLSQLSIYTIKAIVVYYSIYSIIPRWSAHQAATKGTSKSPASFSGKHIAEFIFVLVIGALCLRMVIQNVVWVHIFPREDRDLSLTNMMARYLYSLFDLIPITFVAVSIKLVQMRLHALRTEAKLVREKLRSELSFLKAQSNPHFLFNTLTGIYGLARKQDSNTPAAIMNLSKIFRYMLYETNRNTTTIKDELQLVSDYIALQRMRFGEHMKISFTKNIDNENAAISPLLLLPLVENAFKHSNDVDMAIDIHVELHKNQLQFRVSNNIASTLVMQEDYQDGIGLSNIKRQLAILYRNYNFRAGKNSSRFEAELTIDLSSYAYV